MLSAVVKLAKLAKLVKLVKLVIQSTNNAQFEGSNTATDSLRQKVGKMKQKDAISSSKVGNAIN
jgi:hypothetical protein